MLDLRVPMVALSTATVVAVDAPLIGVAEKDIPHADTVSNILLENGGNMLLENGGIILLE